MSDTQQNSEQPRPQPVGPLVATIIIVLVLALGGVYMLVRQMDKIHAQQTQNAL